MKTFEIKTIDGMVIFRSEETKSAIQIATKHNAIEIRELYPWARGKAKSIIGTESEWMNFGEFKINFYEYLNEQR